MKKKIIGLTIAGIVALSGVVGATSMWGSYKGNDIIRLTVNDAAVSVSDVPVINYNNRTMIPIYLLSQVGINYSWDPGNKTVNITKPSSTNTTPVNSASINKLKQLSAAENLYGQLLDLGRDLQHIMDLHFFATDTQTEAAYNTENKYLNDAINLYNKMIAIDLTPYTNAGINMNGVSSVLNTYYKAIDKYKTADTLLGPYITNKNSSTLNDMLAARGDGYQLASQGVSDAKSLRDTTQSQINNYQP